MDIAQLILVANQFIDQGRKYARKGLSIFAFGEYQKAHGVLQAIDAGWAQETISLTKPDELALAALRERLSVALSGLLDGKGQLSGPGRLGKDEFRQAVANALSELEALFMAEEV